MIVKIEKLDHQGRGIAYLDKPIFIDNALIDEMVDIDIINEYKKYMIGKVNNYVKVSDKRVKPICKYFGICGGCKLMHMSYDDQLVYKKNKVREIMNKFFSSNVKINDTISSTNLFYRNKATFKVNQVIGYFKSKSNDIVKIDKCMIVDDRINEVLNDLQKMNIDTDEVMVRCGNDIMNTYNDNKDILIDIDDYHFNVSPNSFFQVNSFLVGKLYNKVVTYLDLNKEDRVLDLYCGVGSIGIYLSKYCKYVYGVEINESAICNANKNKVINDIDNIDFKCLDAKDIDDLNYNVNKVVVDPPRNGLNKKTIDYLNKNNFDKIVYVSCDPVTLARDLKLLADKYSVLEITPFDMFPHNLNIK